MYSIIIAVEVRLSLRQSLSYIETNASSACEMVAEILQYFADNVRLKGGEADCIYAGIMIDTDNYMRKTGVQDFRGGRIPAAVRC